MERCQACRRGIPGDSRACPVCKIVHPFRPLSGLERSIYDRSRSVYQSAPIGAAGKGGKRRGAHPSGDRALTGD